MKILLFDMYGVIIKESKGNFTPYVYSHFPNTERSYYRSLYENASIGVIDSDMFFSTLGFEDPKYAMKDYLENHLTLDGGFKLFAEQFKNKYSFSLLSNDVLAWSEYIRTYYNIDKYFKHAVISANTGYRKPDIRIFKIALDRLNVTATDCIFVDNSVSNLNVAEELGIDTILFNRDNEIYKGKIVYSFDELACLLNK